MVKNKKLLIYQWILIIEIGNLFTRSWWQIKNLL